MKSHQSWESSDLRGTVTLTLCVVSYGAAVSSHNDDYERNSMHPVGPRKGRRLTVFLVLFIGSVSFIILSLLRQEVWVGGFPQCEYRFHIIDPMGKPIRGIRLMVTDRDHQPAYSYPISDFSDKIPDLASDKDGVIIVHHVALPIEFTGRRRYFLFLLPIDTCPPPSYDCRFFGPNGTELAVVPYSKLGQLAHNNRSPGISVLNRALFPPPSDDLPEHLRVAGNRSLPMTLEFPVVTLQIVIEPSTLP
jgi:hypothetical protein